MGSKAQKVVTACRVRPSIKQILARSARKQSRPLQFLLEEILEAAAAKIEAAEKSNAEDK